MSSEVYNKDDAEYISENDEERNSLSENEESHSSGQDYDAFLKVIRPKLRGKRKRSGRKSTWHEEMVNDLVDIVCEDEYHFG